MERQRHLPSASSLSTSPGLGVGRADVESFIWISHMDGLGPSTWAIFIAFPGVLSVAGSAARTQTHAHLGWLCCRCWHDASPSKPIFKP